MLGEGTHQAAAAALGDRLAGRLRAAELPAVAALRQRGLWVGIDLAAGQPSARQVCERLLAEVVEGPGGPAGLLAKDTHEHTIRLAPPLIITEDEADWIAERIIAVLS
jgi:ornithine--oxo-acid transaminase